MSPPCEVCHARPAIRTVNEQHVCLFCPDTERPDINLYGEPRKTAPNTRGRSIFGG